MGLITMQYQFLYNLPNLSVQVQCVVYTVQCTGCTVALSVLPAKNKDVAVETVLVKLKLYLLK